MHFHTVNHKEEKLKRDILFLVILGIRCRIHDSKWAQSLGNKGINEIYFWHLLCGGWLRIFQSSRRDALLESGPDYLSNPEFQTVGHYGPPTAQHPRFFFGQTGSASTCVCLYNCSMMHLVLMSLKVAFSFLLILI